MAFSSFSSARSARRMALRSSGGESFAQFSLSEHQPERPLAVGVVGLLLQFLPRRCRWFRRHVISPSAFDPVVQCLTLF